MLKKTQFAFVGMCLLATFICINIAVSLLGRKLTLDVTNDQRYSIGQETKDWLKSNEKDIYVPVGRLPSVHPFDRMHPTYLFRAHGYGRDPGGDYLRL